MVVCQNMNTRECTMNYGLHAKKYLTLLLLSTLSNATNIEHPLFFLLSDKSHKKTIKCSDCKRVPLIPFQTSCGKLSCSECMRHECRVVDCIKLKDNRMKVVMLGFEMTCHLQTKGCEWVGKLSQYREHITHDCLFAKRNCTFCKREVVFKDLETHRETYECKLAFTAYVECPLKCGHVDQKWMMESHMFDECRNASTRCPLEDDCDSKQTKCDTRRNHSECIARNPESFFNVWKSKFKDEVVVRCNWTHGTKTKTFRKHYRKYNGDNAILELCFSVATGHLIIRVIEKLVRDRHGAKQRNETWNDTKVTVVIVNQRTTSTRNYVRSLPIVKNNVGNLLFSEPNFIPLTNMSNNLQTNTCFSELDMITFHFVFDFTIKCRRETFE